MTSPFQNSQDNPRHSYSHDPTHPHVTYARVAATNSRERTGSSGRTGPTSFSNILNPFDGDWNNAYPSGQARNEEGLEVMTQNGANLDAAGGGFYPTPTQQLPESSRAFELFMTRATLDTLTGMDPVFGGRTEHVPGTAGSSTTSNHNFPRPSYLEGSHYLARLEQQARQRALTQRESNGVHAANGNGLGPQGAGKPSNPSHLGIARDVVERAPAHTHAHAHAHTHTQAQHEVEDTMIDPLPTRWGSAKEDRAAGLEVLSDGLEVKYTGARNPSERDHEACAIRADHHMPLQCGLYYYEVTILSRKHTE